MILAAQYLCRLVDCVCYLVNVKLRTSSVSFNDLLISPNSQYHHIASLCNHIYCSAPLRIQYMVLKSY
jgi:hypothetical protein